jgi:uncharacterized Zn finger protein
MNREFKILSSDGVTSYAAGFSLEGGIFKIYCGCPAGILGNWCKHKMSLVIEDAKLLGKLEPEVVDELLALLRKSQFRKLVEDMIEAEKAEQIAKKKVSDAKMAIGRAAKIGMKI